MGLFSKRGDDNRNGLPELPELPSLPKLEGIDGSFGRTEETLISERVPERISMLPAFPVSESAKRISMQAVKDAVRPDPMMPEETDDEEENSKVEFVSSPRPNFRGYTPSLKINQGFESVSLNKAREDKKTEPVFVRMDKFQEAVENFEDVKEKLKHVEALFVGLKQIREKEGDELAEWERELKAIKLRLEGIDRGLFRQLD